MPKAAATNLLEPGTGFMEGQFFHGLGVMWSGIGLGMILIEQGT